MALSRQQLSAFLAELQAQDENEPKTGWVPAGCVETALRRANIITSTQQDEALLMLVVNAETGKVGYMRLKEEVELATKRTTSEPIASISQQDLVFKIMGELRELFNSFDLGGISIQGLRSGLARLGLKETQALKELLRHSYEMTFHQLVSALTKVDEREPQFDNLAKTQVNRNRNIFDEERTAEQRARKPIARSEPEHAPVPHRYPDPENRDDNMLFGDRAGMNSSSQFATTAQMSSSPVRGRIAPITSAGYDTRDKGLFRQQVHAAIRRLDAGEFDARMFVRRLSDLGIAPLPEQVQKLLDRQVSGNLIPFKEWVKAFEPFFEEKTFQEEPSEESSKVPAAATHDPKTIRGSHYRPRQNGGIFGFDEQGQDRDAHMARAPITRPQRSTINILAPEYWDLPDSTQQGRKQRAPIRTTSASAQPDFLCWSEQDYLQPSQQQERPMRGLATARTEYKPPPFAREGDPIVAKNVSGIDRTFSARRQQRRTPFGTEADYGASFASGVPPPSFG